MTSADAHEDGRERRAHDELEKLRSFLVGPEQRELEELRHRKLDAQELADKLPDAVAIRESHDERLGKVLSPTVEKAVRRSVERNPKPLVDAISPVIGPAIRKAIRDALSSMLEGFNEALENSFTPQGLRWRLEARRTGKPFSEVVLMHSLVYRVEQVFLVHRETGLLLQHVVAPTVVARDADMVSGMLTAIQDFVRDSFGTDAGGGLGQIEMDGVVVELVHSGGVVVAALVRGVVPPALRARLQLTAEEIQREWARDVADFDGDSSAFVSTRDLLEECLVQQEREPESGGPRLGRWTLVAAAAAALFFGGRALLSSLRTRSAFRAAETALAGEPGYVLLAADRDAHALTFLRDPDARAASDVVGRAELGDRTPKLVEHPHVSREDALVMLRAERALAPPDGVQLEIDGGRLTAKGTASADWVRRAPTSAMGVAGVASFDGAGVVALERLAFDDLCERLHELRLPFATAWGELSYCLGDLDVLRRDFVELDRLSVLLGLEPRVWILGASLPSENADVAGQRADGVRGWVQGSRPAALHVESLVDPEMRFSGARFEITLAEPPAAASGGGGQ